MLVNLRQKLDVSGLNNEESESNDDDAKHFKSLLIEQPRKKSLGRIECLRGENARNDLHGEIMHIFKVMSQIITLPSGNFHGACSASGAQRTVIGKQQAELYSLIVNIDITQFASKRV